MRNKGFKDWLSHLSGRKDALPADEVSSDGSCDQEAFKERVKLWLRQRKNEIRDYAVNIAGVSVESRAPYPILAKLLGVSISSVNNWLYLKGQKVIPEERVKAIEELMAVVPLQDVSPADEKMVKIENESVLTTGGLVESDISALVNAMKKRLTDAAFRKFYMEAESVGLTLDAYLRSLFE